MNIQPKTRSESTGHKGSKRISPSHQIYLLSGHAKRVATALRNVFKSDAKEESTKSKEQGQGSKYLSVEPLRASQETVSIDSSTCIFYNYLLDLYNRNFFSLRRYALIGYFALCKSSSGNETSWLQITF